MAVLVYTENWNGNFKKLSYELVSYAHSIAKSIGSQVVCLTVGNVSNENLQLLAQYGASKVLVCKNADLEKFTTQSYSSLIAKAAETEKAKVLIFASNASGEALAPRVSVKLSASMVSNAVGVPTSVEPFVVRKKAYSGKAFADVVLDAPVKVLTLTQNAYKVEENPQNLNIEDFQYQVDSADLKMLPSEIIKSDGKLSVSDAEILISGGRGLKGPENWGMVEEMAQILGAGTCCSRPVADLGWRPHYEHVGQTGKVVAPNLYIAIGISGAIQHLAGVNGSKVLVAINKDPEAPFFDSADYGIVGDAFEVIPQLNEAFRKFKAQQ